MVREPGITFAFPPHGYGLTEESFRPYLGAAFVQASLIEAGIDSEQYVRSQPAPLGVVAQEILSFGREIVGLTCYDTNYHQVRVLARELKGRAPEVAVVVGGPSATTSDEIVLGDCEAVDCCVRGEAETTAPLLVATPRREWAEVPGVTARHGEGVVRAPSPPPVTSGVRGAELDVLPSPFAAGIVDETWVDPLGFTMMTSRGCPYNCTYCAFRSVTGTKVRRHSVGRVLRDLEVLARVVADSSAHGDAARVLLTDDCFNADLRRAKELCQAIAEADLGLTLWSELSARRVDEELLFLMRRAGFRTINIGLESGSPEVLRNIRKARGAASEGESLEPERRFLEQVREALRLARAAGLVVHLSMIQGLPGEGPEEAAETLRVIEELSPEHYYHNQLMVFPGTKLMDHHEEFGLSVEPSETVLPLCTHHAYDLESVALHPGADVFEGGRRLVFELVTALFGVAPPPEWGTGASFAMLPSVLEWSHGDLAWLARSLPMFTRIVQRGRELGSRAARSEARRRLADAGVSTQSLYFLAPDGPGERLLISSYYKPIHRVAPLVREVSLSSIAGEEPSSIPDGQLLVHLQPSQGDHDDGELLAQRLVLKEAAVVDGCRWCSSPCPAPELRRVVIDSGGGVRPCGGAIEPCGRVGADLGALRSRLTAVAERVESERGCADCAAARTCARCIFPAPLGVETYCALQRRGAVARACAEARAVMRARWLDNSMQWRAAAGRRGERA